LDAEATLPRSGIEDGGATSLARRSLVPLRADGANSCKARGFSSAEFLRDEASAQRACVSSLARTMDNETNMSAQPQRQELLRFAANWRQDELALPDPFPLDSGASLCNARLAWQCAGPNDAPLIIALGGISAHRRPCAEDGRGWWEAQCGEGRVLDTLRYRVLGIDWLGGVDASSGPCAGETFPQVSTKDQARALLLLLNRLGVRRVHLLVGASYGGAVAQQLALLLGERLRRLVLLSAAHRTSQFGLALRHIQRAILDLGGDGRDALALARSLAVLGYRTPDGIEARFGEVDSGEDVLAWLAHHGERFTARFNTAAYRRLGESLDEHAVDPAAIRVPTTLLAVREDLIVPLALLREFAARAAACELVEISSAYGHDAFLKEEGAVATLLRAATEVTA
jgi:homoserine O-acetyltransferase